MLDHHRVAGDAVALRQPARAETEEPFPVPWFVEVCRRSKRDRTRGRQTCHRAVCAGGGPESRMPVLAGHQSTASTSGPGINLEEGPDGAMMQLLSPPNTFTPESPCRSVSQHHPLGQPKKAHDAVVPCEESYPGP